MAKSIIILDTRCDVPRLPPVLHAYGAPDDHHRLTYLLADRVEEILGREVDQLRVCRDRCSVWSDRLNALRSALELGRDKCTTDYAFAIADIDALVPQGQDDFDERGIIKERNDFFNTLCTAIDRTGWVVFRPNPSQEADQKLEGLSCEVESRFTPDASDAQGLRPERLSILPPDYRPVAQWLHRTGRLNEERFDDIVEQVKDVAGHILGLAYDALGRRARDTGKLVSAVRQPQALNHKLGRFEIDGGDASAMSLPGTAVASLRDCGFLQPNVDGSTDFIRMPRSIRMLLEHQAQLSASDEVTKVHTVLATDPGPHASREAHLEVPFHALRSGNIELAKEKAVFSADLRAHGTRLSRAGAYGAAAELFQFLVDTFDPKDAYAHEYLGYNLARQPGINAKDRILTAYKAAHEYTNKKNPLYHGRLVGFRAELGYDITDEFNRAMSLYAHRQASQLAYFAKAVFDGLTRGHQDALRAKLTEKWKTSLKLHAPLLVAP